MQAFEPSIEVIDLELRQTILRALGIEELRIGRHILRGPDRIKSGELLIQKLWITEVILSPENKGCLVNSQTSNGQSIHCVVPSDTGLVAAGPLVFGHKEGTTSTDRLADMDLWSGTSGIPLSGVRYQLFVATANLTTAMRISNPTQPKHLALQQSLLITMELFQNLDNGQRVSEFTRCWRRLISSE